MTTFTRNTNAMSKILVTGGSGFVGLALVAHLKELGHNVKNIDLVLGHDILQLYTPDQLEMRKHEFCPDYIVHLAAWPRVGRSIEDPTGTMLNNVMSTSCMLNFAKYCNVERFVFAGSSSAAGDGYMPLSPYALQKLTSEIECKLYTDLFNLDTATMRYFNVYDERHISRDKHGTLISKIRGHIKDKTPLTIFGDGSVRRDMAYLQDVVKATTHILLHARKTEGMTFDVGTGSNWSVADVVSYAKTLNPDLEVRYETARQGDMRYTKADTTMLREFGYNIETPIHLGLLKAFT